jgi:pimeloyl-ACP methyl ester carboxylesterase
VRFPRRAPSALSGTKVRLLAVVLVIVATAYGAVAGSAASAPAVKQGELPPPVQVRAEPEGVTLEDPAFEALPGARADFGRLGGAVYQVEVPDNWNGRLVLFMHGYGELGPETSATAPDFRRYLIGHGFAWGASSFSSTSLIPGRAVDETAAVWDYFARTYGRPNRTYITGFSMGGAATHIAAERYPDRFDGALALCGAAGQTPSVQIGANFFVAAAYAAGVTQAEYDSADLSTLIQDRIRPALRDPQADKRFEDIMVDLTGGVRAFAREGFRFEEETNWRRVELLVPAGFAPNADTKYRLRTRAATEEFNRDVIRLRTNDEPLRAFVDGNELTGNLQMPLVSLHTTGDGQVPIEQARILQRTIDAAGKGDLLVQRIFRDPSHCGFTTPEQVAGLEALMAWVEDGKKPAGDNVLVRDWRTLGRSFELYPRPGTPEANAVRGAAERVVVRGNLTLDGAPFDSRTLGAVVVRNGLVTPCQYTLPRVENGRYEITVMANAEAGGCGAKDAQIVLWTFAQEKILYSTEVVPWPKNGRRTRFDGSFSTAVPDGAAPATVGFAGEVYDRRVRQMRGGTRIEAYVGETRCAVTSVRRAGSFAGFSMDVVGPESVPGCERGATLTFRINGRPAAETATNELARESPLDLSLK